MTLEQKPAAVSHPLPVRDHREAPRTLARRPGSSGYHVSFPRLTSWYSLSLTPGFPNADLRHPRLHFLPGDTEPLHSAYLWGR